MVSKVGRTVSGRGEVFDCELQMVSVPYSMETALSSTIKKTTRSRSRDISQWQDT